MATIAGLKSHDSILSKLDTFKRKKKARQELEDLAKESKQAIENAVNLMTIEDPKEYQLDEGEERSFIEKSSQVIDVRMIVHISCFLFLSFLFIAII